MPWASRRPCLAWSGLPGQDSLVRTPWSGLSGQDSLVRTLWSGLPGQGAGWRRAVGALETEREGVAGLLGQGDHAGVAVRLARADLPLQGQRAACGGDEQEIARAVECRVGNGPG